MPWYIPISLTENIKKRVCIYLLQRYLGQFLEEKLTLNQLSVDLYNGRGTVENVSLDMQALNDLGEKQNWPIEFVNGYLEKLSFIVPWSTILKDSTFIEVSGLKLIVQPKQRNESATSMFESMWSSMTNSMQLAQECMKQEAANIDTSQPLEGIEIFAQAIDSILSRVKVKFIDVTIQMEHVPKDSLNGVGIVINIASMEYSDEAGNDPPTGEATENEQSKAYIVSSFTTKNFYLNGITISSMEFPSRARTISKSLMMQSQGENENDDSLIAMIQKSTTGSTDNIEEEKSEKPSDVFDEERLVLLIGKFSGRQEIRVRLKQSEDVNGPKVSIEINLGAFYLFLSPRQVYVLLELANGLSSPDNEDTSNVVSRQKCMEKPMSGLDYQRVEQELQQQLHPSNAYVSGLQAAQGWSTAALDDSDSEENFLPMRPNTTSVAMYDSAVSTVSSSLESSLTSSVASSLTEATSNKTRRKGHNIDSDPTAEISHFHIRLASLVVVVLHEDLLTLSNDNNLPSLVQSSVRQMQATAENFFANISSLVIAGYGPRNFDDCKVHFEKACRHNHLRLIAAPIQIECDETTTLTAFALSGKLVAAKLEILECLKHAVDEPVEYVRLLSFNEDTSTSNTINTKPCLKLQFKHIERTIKTGLTRKMFVPKTDITIALDNCTIEIDISIVDRICALVYSPKICVIQKSQNVWGKNATSSTQVQSLQTESQLDIKITSPSLSIKLRFPIPDFRPAHDMQKAPWWRRNVRPSFLILKCIGASATSTLQTNQAFQSYSIQTKVLYIDYYNKEDEEPLHIAKAGVDERLTSLDDSLNCPRMVLQVYPVKADLELDDGQDANVDVMTQSTYGNLNFQTFQHSPFSAKRVVHQSDTPHSKSQHEDIDELIIPGDKQEISDFIEATTKSARIRLNLSFPTVTMQLLSKHVYEVLYNHISSDLLLWEPSAPKPKYDQSREPNSYNISNIETQETYAMCKSGIQYESDSESSEETDPECSTVFYSVYDGKAKQNLPRKTQRLQYRGQSYLILKLQIGQGLLCLNSPVRDLATNVIPEQHGEFVLGLDDTTIFSVSGYGGDDNLGYVCIQSKRAQLYHCNMFTTPSQCPPLKEIGTALGRHLHPTIYKSEQGILANSKDRGGDREMISVAVKIQANHETHHVKTVRVALGINKSTLRHRMCLEPNSWITQLIDFFNIKDYNVPGYHAKDVLTELHLHLWDCAIDYRPFHLPLRSVVTLGTFSMSSHLSATANTSTLRFIAEECGLFLSEKAPPKNGIPSSTPVDLKQDYVSVVDLGLFELSLRINDKNSGINPHIDLRASNDILNIRTCSDSGRALMQLITYFASDGDLIPDEDIVVPVSSYSSPRHNPEQELVSVEQQDISNLSKSQHQQVNELLGEAMEESLSVQEGSIVTQNYGAKMFFFPDEGQALQENMKPLPQVTTELGDVTFRSNKSSDTDEEFCIIGEEAGLGILPKNGLPDIRWLTDDPLRLIDNHFNIPLGKTDILKPPKHFPIPVMRYTLCNMTIVWQMYGGHDFKRPENEKKEKKMVNFADMPLQEGIAFSNTQTGEIIFNNFAEKKKPKLNWIVQGGVNREHDILIELELSKIRFQHEVYPENTLQASRQVLLVTELEIRDLLQSSEINKFLYQYTSQARPKQSHAHMIAIKAVHIRPDLKLKAQECCLRVSALPLRLNIDQDTLLFLINFFNELGGTTTKQDEAPNVTSKHNTPTHQPPVMTISTDNDQLLEQAQKIVDDNLLLLLDDVKCIKDEEKAANVSKSTAESSLPIYFRKIVFSPDVPIRLDYQGKMDVTHGPIAGLLMGLFQLNSSELRLRRLSNNHGLLGFDKLMSYCLHEWISDIKKNQLPSLLGGVGPMHSLVQFFQGIKDLFWLPIEQYQKDGRIVRGLQRGANSFTTSTAMAALELTSRIIHLIQITAETAYDMMSPGPSVRRAIKSKGRKRRYNQPQDIREGMANAYNVVKEGLGETAENIVRVASHEREQKGVSGAVGGVLRQIPPTFMKPIIIASEATNNVLGGMQSQLLPDSRREANQKWKNNDL